MPYRHGAIGLAKKAAQAARVAKKAKEKAEKPAVDVVEPFDLKTFLFDKQLAFVEDPAPFKTAVCSRRSGKTTSCAADMVATALSYDGGVCLYVTLSRALAKKIIWPELRKLNRKHALGGVENKVELSITFPNESVIYLSGAGTVDQVEMFRGMALVKVYVDEAQSFRSHLQELCDDVFGPALMDHNGTLVLIGTPAPVPSGYFYECAHNQEWGHHNWTFFDNPFIAVKSKRTHRELLDRELKRRGVLETDPSIRREFFGEWVVDENSLLLHYNPAMNDYDALPPGSYQYILGVDLGFDDADSLSILAYSQHSPCTWLVEEVVTNGQVIDDLAKQITYLCNKYEIVKMVADTGGLGKKIVESMAQRYGFPLEAAEKQRKIEHYAFLDNAMRLGMFKAKKTSRFAQDCFLLEKDRNKSTPDKTVVRGHSDPVDSALYPFMVSPAYYFVAPKEKSQPGTKQFDSEFEDAIFEANMARVQKEQQNREGQQGMTWETDQNGVPPWLKY